MTFARDGRRENAEAAIAVVAVGWRANTAALDLPTAGVEINPRGFVQVDANLQTSAPHIFAAGDVTGRLLLVPQAIHDGFIAATNAVQGVTATHDERVNPIGSFTDPEYAQVGMTEAKAREKYDVATAIVHFASTTRTIIDGRTTGFCKLIVDRVTHEIRGCHVVGESAVEITQIAAIAIAARLRVDDLAHVPLSFPTYAGILGRAAAAVTRQLNLKSSRQTAQAGALRMLETA
jgi:dihydrolipoamide dehydrogenase